LHNLVRGQAHEFAPGIPSGLEDFFRSGIYGAKSARNQDFRAVNAGLTRE